MRELAVTVPEQQIGGCDAGHVLCFTKRIQCRSAKQRRDLKKSIVEIKNFCEVNTEHILMDVYTGKKELPSV